MTIDGDDERERIRDAGEAVGNAVIERLHALTRRGYLAKIGADRGITFIHLEHPTAPELIIWGDGQVISSAIGNDEQRTAIEFNDRGGFERFLGTVKEPSVFTKLHRTTIGDVVRTALVWGLLLGVGLIVSKVWEAAARWWRD